MNTEKGIFYIAIGENMRSYLSKSIQSVRQHLDLPITVATDLEDIPPVEQLRKVEWSRRITHAVKPEFLQDLPYERTLFLDCDTEIAKPSAAYPLNLITDQYGYHVAASHAVYRCCDQVDPAINCAASLNSGVLFLRKSWEVLRALAIWKQRHDENGGDQIGLTRSLLQNRVPTYYLPPEFNYRGHNIFDPSEIKIIHLKQLS